MAFYHDKIIIMKKAILLIFLFVNSFISFSKAQNLLEVGDTTIFHIINFDSTYNYINIGNSSQNLWQVGKPHKTFFDSAYTLPFAMVTDTLNNYPISNYSYFDLYIGDFSLEGYYVDIFIDFWHKIDTDTLKDGGFITVSWDKGLTWMNIINDTVYNGEKPGNTSLGIPNLYSTDNILFNGEYGFSGHTNDWKHTTLGWWIPPMKKSFPPDTMIIRFNFISDSIDNPKEGWMIDNIRLFSIDMGSGVTDINSKSNILSVFPNPYVTTTEISLDKTYENVDLSVFNLQGEIIKKKTYRNCSKMNLDRTEIENGLYFLQITLDKKIIETKKIIMTN